jgi:predicted  nucleic acid-binding Zn-ribbon protein
MGGIIDMEKEILRAQIRDLMEENQILKEHSDELRDEILELKSQLEAALDRIKYLDEYLN